MSLPSTYIQPVASPVGAPVKLTGGARLHLSFTVGLSYRVHNLGTQQANVHDASTGSTSLKWTVAPSTFLDVVAAQTDYWIEESVSSSIIVEPLLNPNLSGAFRSPLSFVLQSLAVPEQSYLVGTFYGIDGRELILPGHSNAQNVLTVSGASPQTLGTIAESSGSVGFSVDVAGFRGVLYGSPVAVVVGSPSTNTSPAAGYSPIEGAPLIYPGPVVLSGRDGVLQMATGPGTGLQPFESYGFAASVSTPAEVLIDVSSSVLSAVLLKWNTSELANANITVSAYRYCKPNGEAGFASQNANVQETFTADGVMKVNHIELDQGYYKVVITTTTPSVDIDGDLYIQRFQ